MRRALRRGFARAHKPHARRRAAERARVMQREPLWKRGERVRVRSENHLRVRRRAHQAAAERATHVAAAERRRIADHHAVEVHRCEQLRKQVALRTHTQEYE